MLQDQGDLERIRAGLERDDREAAAAVVDVRDQPLGEPRRRAGRCRRRAPRRPADPRPRAIR
ncbi:hypothetical protein [Clavibacter tessellarius]|uniref:hypothetical protein n=1 Tax=Clavibacter tessellarius TaxID=31965 RepID=UPI003251D2DE